MKARGEFRVDEARMWASQGWRKKDLFVGIDVIKLKIKSREKVLKEEKESDAEQGRW